MCVCVSVYVFRFIQCEIGLCQVFDHIEVEWKMVQKINLHLIFFPCVWSLSFFSFTHFHGNTRATCWWYGYPKHFIKIDHKVKIKWRKKNSLKSIDGRHTINQSIVHSLITVAIIYVYIYIAKVKWHIVDMNLRSKGGKKTPNKRFSHSIVVVSFSLFIEICNW